MINSFTRKIFDFFLFTSLYIACCAVIMVYQTYELIIQKPINFYFAAFVFFSTVCSYNFHWFLTPHSVTPSQRLKWDMHHKVYHLLLSGAGLTCAFILFFFISEHWFFIGIAVAITFLYSAPKISFPSFQWLKKVAVGKTIFLASAWTYVTSVLPIMVSDTDWSGKALFFCSSQFFLICAICILFDYRDREDDRADGIRSMITYFNETSINLFFALCIAASLFCILILNQFGLPWINIILLLIPVFIVTALYKHAKRNFSDYLYYFVLDGLMMFSGLLLWVMNLF